MLGDLPVRLTPGQLPLSNGLIKRLTNHRLRQPRILRKFSPRSRFRQTESVHEKFKRFIDLLHIELAFHITPLHIATRMARFGSTQNAAIGERDFTIRAAADAGIIAKAPVVEGADTVSLV